MKNITIFVILACLLFPFAALEGAGDMPLAPEPDTVAVQRTQAGVVENTELRDYLVGVLFAEMPHTYEKEALKAQVVCAHTLMLYRKETQDKSYDITDSSMSDQGYLDETAAKAKYGGKYEEARAIFAAAVDEVISVTLTYEGEICLSTYHDISAGKTETASVMWGGEYPYLTAVESVGDLLSPDYLSGKKFTESELLAALGLKESDEGIGEIQRSQSGTVTDIELFGAEFTGAEIRKKLELKSANFDVEKDENEYVFTVRGHGHCVGMSQYGANYMAALGSSYEEILQWYFKGVKTINDEQLTIND